MQSACFQLTTKTRQVLLRKEILWKFHQECSIKWWNLPEVTPFIKENRNQEGTTLKENRHLSEFRIDS